MSQYYNEVDEDDYEYEINYQERKEQAIEGALANPEKMAAYKADFVRMVQKYPGTGALLREDLSKGQFEGFYAGSCFIGEVGKAAYISGDIIMGDAYDRYKTILRREGYDVSYIVSEFPVVSNLGFRDGQKLFMSIEEFTLLIEESDTPQTNKAAAKMIEWLDEMESANAN